MRTRLGITAAGVTSIAISLAAPALAETLAGPVPAHIERIGDGDTLHVRARIWLGHEIAVAVRLRGVDTPEMRSRCDAERRRAEAARDFVADLLGNGQVLLTAIEGGKYFGRVIADVATAEGRDLASAILAAGHGRAYDGGQRAGWCDFAER